MRIVHAYKVFKPDVEGGIPEIIDILASGLAEIGHDIEVVVARDKGFGKSETRGRVHITRCSSLGKILALPIAPTYPYYLYRSVKKANILALHAPFPLADPIVALLPRRIGVVVHWHSDIVRQKRSAALLAPIRRLMLERADRIIVAHESIIENTRALDYYHDKISIVPYGIDVDKWQNIIDVDEIKIDKLKLDHPILFVAVGRLVSYKGFDILVQAMTKVNGDLVICGEGPEQTRLQGLIDKLHLSHRVKLTGKVTSNEIRCYMKAATAFVFPSVTEAETFGISQLEAMASGLPIINTYLRTAVPHIARNQIEAITINPYDPAKLAEAMTIISSNDEFRNKLKLSSLSRVICYSKHFFIKGISNVYSDLIN